MTDLKKVYEDKLSLQKKKIGSSSNPSADDMKEFGRLGYIVNHLGELDKGKSIEKLEYEAIEYANEMINAGNKLAKILGISPLRTF